MKKKIIIIAAAVVLLAIIAAVIFFVLLKKDDKKIKFYGNVELNYVDIAFLEPERLKETYVKEGDYVKIGQILATQETDRLEFKIRQAVAEKQALEQALLKLNNGYLPEEIEKAEANLKMAKAQADLAKINYERQKGVEKGTDGTGVSKRELDAMLTNKIVADEAYNRALKELALLKKGYRSEDIGQAQAKVKSLEAQIAFLNKQKEDATLISPADGFIKTKYLQVGEIASSQRPVYKISITSPVWIRAYVPEPILGLINIGDNVKIHTDSHPNKSLDGYITYVSSDAEFTPKSVQTEELRTSLVYQIKIEVLQPEHLKQGMPVTIIY